LERTLRREEKAEIEEGRLRAVAYGQFNFGARACEERIRKGGDRLSGTEVEGIIREY
jgi:hypothetical protein